MMNSAGRSRFPFTASQWQELEHQALVLKYMVCGMPVPPDLLYTIRRSLDSSLSSKLLLHQSQQIGWNSFQMGFGRKIDPEPGRCRRTDGKKWRCSKEAFPDSKYCERHMHRGRNRSRKPVEVMTTTTNITSSTAIKSSSSSNFNNTSAPTAIPISLITRNPTNSSPSSPNSHSYLTSAASNPLLYPHSSSSRPPGGSGFMTPQDYTTSNFLMEPNNYSHGGKDYRSSYGMKEEVDEHAFFSESSGTMRSVPASGDDSWQLGQLTMGSAQMSHLKQRTFSQNGQLEHIKFGIPLNNNMDGENDDEQPKKIMHHFIDEWPPRNRDSNWIDSSADNNNNNTKASNERTQLSISVSNSLHDFFMTQNGK